jgi:molecular chaperone GrpE
VQENENNSGNNENSNIQANEHLEQKENIETENSGSTDAESLLDMQSKIDDLQDKLLRQMAETENMRTRFTRMVDETKDYAIFSFCKDLVQVMDNLTRALEHVPQEMSDDIKNTIIGVEMTQKELASIFTKHGIEIIEPQVNDKFDYNLHHAIAQVSVKEQVPGTVVNTMQPGYKIKSRLIRPAAVSVAQ